MLPSRAPTRPQSCAVIDLSEVEAARRPFRTGAAVLRVRGLAQLPSTAGGEPVLSRSPAAQRILACCHCPCPGAAGGEVESSQLTNMHSRDALEDMADHLAHATPAAGPQDCTTAGP